jgi:hypothetical protein
LLLLLAARHGHSPAKMIELSIYGEFLESYVFGGCSKTRQIVQNSFSNTLSDFSTFNALTPIS